MRKFWFEIKKKNLKSSAASIFCAFLIFGLVLPVFAEDIQDLNRQIDVKKREIESLDQKQKELEEQIGQKENEKKTLNNQLEIVEDNIEQTEMRIEKTGKEIERTAFEIDNLEIEITEKEMEIDKQKKNLSETIRIMYQYDQKNLLEIIFAYDSFSNFVDEWQNMEKLQGRGKEVLDNIKKIKQDLESKQIDLKKQKESLDNLKVRLDGERSQLDYIKQGKERLLRETQMQEEKFQELLEEARAEQEAANAEIQNLQFQIQSQYIQTQPDTWKDLGGKGNLAWPIMPSMGISAYFMDPNYYAAFGINHYAIDVPTPQGTPIHAPADGVVVKNRDAGYGYSYIMIYHGSNLSTVYGHVSGFAAAEGQKIKKGDVIGYTGGTPGTRGAGWLTTGPHLHFEVRINGNPVDPLGYLAKL